MVFWDIAHPRDLSYFFGINPCRGAVVSGEWHPFDRE